MDFLIDIGLYLCYIGCIAGTVAAIIFPIIYIIKHPENLKSSLMGTGGIAVIFVISYFISGGEMGPKYAALGVETENASKMVGAGLITLYLLGLLSVVIAIGSEVKNLFK